MNYYKIVGILLCCCSGLVTQALNIRLSRATCMSLGIMVLIRGSIFKNYGVGLVAIYGYAGLITASVALDTYTSYIELSGDSVYKAAGDASTTLILGLTGTVFATMIALKNSADAIAKRKEVNK